MKHFKIKMLLLFACMLVAARASGANYNYKDEQGVCYHYYSDYASVVADKWYETDPYYGSEMCFFNSNYDVTSVVIPEQVVIDDKAYPVTKIEVEAFCMFPYLESLTLPSSISDISSAVFEECYNLKSVYFNRVDPPLASYFGYRVSQTTLYVPAESVDKYKNAYAWEDFGKIIGNSFTSDDGLFNLNINGDVKSVTVTKFNKAEADAVAIPESVSYQGSSFAVSAIGEGAFAESVIKSVTIPASIKEIGSNAFSGWPGVNETHYLGDLKGWCEINIAEDGSPICGAGKLFVDGKEVTGNVTIPEGTEQIGRGALTNLDIASVAIPESVTSIGAEAFVGTPLHDVTIPSSVESIGNYAFAWCTNLNVVHCKAETPAAVEGNGLSSSLLLVPENCETKYADWGNFDAVVADAFVSDNAKYMVNNDNATLSCAGSADGATLVIFSGAAEYAAIADWIPGELTVNAVNASAFEGNTDVEVVYLPASIAAIGKSAFGSSSLRHLHVLNPNPITIDASVFADYQPKSTASNARAKAPVETGNGRTLYVPDGSEQLYRNAPVWSDFFSTVAKDIPLGVDAIDSDDDATISVVDGEIRVIGAAEGTLITVHTIDGKTIYSGTNGYISVSAGIYIVKVGGKAVKIAVK